MQKNHRIFEPRSSNAFINVSSTQSSQYLFVSCHFRRPRHPYIPPKATVSTSNDGTLENHYAEYNQMLYTLARATLTSNSISSTVLPAAVTESPKHRKHMFLRLFDLLYSQL